MKAIGKKKTALALATLLVAGGCYFGGGGVGVGPMYPYPAYGWYPPAAYVGIGGFAPYWHYHGGYRHYSGYHGGSHGGGHGGHR